jgi:hypothetical protein
MSEPASLEAMMGEFVKIVEQRVFGLCLPFHLDAAEAIADVLLRFYFDECSEPVRKQLLQELTRATRFRMSATLAAEASQFQN